MRTTVDGNALPDIKAKKPFVQNLIINAFIVNLLLNGFIAWCAFGHTGTIPISGGMQSIFCDALLTAFLLAFIIFLIVSLQTRRAARIQCSSVISSEGRQAKRYGLLAQAVFVGLGGATPIYIIVHLMWSMNVEQVPALSYVVTKMFVAGGLAAMVTWYASSTAIESSG